MFNYGHKFVIICDCYFFISSVFSYRYFLYLIYFSFFLVLHLNFHYHTQNPVAKTILSNNTDNAINFRGLLVGNPYVDPFSNDVTMMQTYYMHGLIALPLYMLWEESCLDPNKYDPDKCGQLMDDMMEDAGDGINPYAVDFPTCLEPDNSDYPPQQEEVNEKGGGSQVGGAAGVGFTVGKSGAITTTIGANENSRIQRSRMMSSSQSSRLVNATSAKSPPFLPKEDVYHPCAEAHLFQYLNRDDVKEALHVDTSRNWSMCTDDINYSSEDSNKPQMYLYEELIEYGKTSGSDLKMMVFSGDDDSSKCLVFPFSFLSVHILKDSLICQHLNFQFHVKQINNTKLI